MNEEHIKLALKHKLAMAYSVELVGIDDHRDIVDFAFDLADAMIERMDKELSALMHPQPNNITPDDELNRHMRAILEALSLRNKE